MTAPIAYFTWEATTDQLRWDETAPQRLGLAADRLESMARWSQCWSADERDQLARIAAQSPSERPDPLNLIVHQHAEEGGVRMLRLTSDWVDGLICGIVSDVLADESASLSPIQVTRQFTHDIAQPLAAVSNYLAALEMIADRGEMDPALVEMVAAARNQAARAGMLIRELRERLIEAEPQ